jgi:hypothetical protein
MISFFLCSLVAAAPIQVVPTDLTATGISDAPNFWLDNPALTTEITNAVTKFWQDLPVITNSAISDAVTNVLKEHPIDLKETIEENNIDTDPSSLLLPPTSS